MQIAVTGANGHLGAALLPKLIQAGHKVRVLAYRTREALEGLNLQVVNGSLFDPSALSRLTEGVDLLCHLAAFISIDKGEEKQVWKTNVEGTSNVVNACLKSKVRRLIHFSSIHACQQAPGDQPLDENRSLVGDSAPIYDRSKAAGEKIVLAAGKGSNLESNLEVIVLSPTGVIGPYDYKPSLMGQMIVSLCNGKLPALVRGGFDWVDIRDVADATLAALEADCVGEKFLLSGRWAGIDEVARLVEQYAGQAKPRLVLPVWLALIGLPFVRLAAFLSKAPSLYTKDSLAAISLGHRSISSHKAAAQLGFSARPLENTIGDTVEWFRNCGMISSQISS